MGPITGEIVDDIRNMGISDYISNIMTYFISRDTEIHVRTRKQNLCKFHIPYFSSDVRRYSCQ